MTSRFLFALLFPSAVGAQAARRIELVETVRIEATDSNGVERFGTATFALMLGNGEIVLADGSERTIRIFGADGAERRRFGREGRGPGEFASLGWVGRYHGDSLLAWDFVLAQLSVLHQATGHARTVTAPEMRRVSFLAGSLTGELAFSTPLRRTEASRPMATATTPGGVAYRIWRDTVDVRTIDLTARTLRQVANGIRRESIIGSLADGRLAGLDRPLGPVTAVALGHDLLVVAESESGTVRAFDAAGAVRHTFTLSGAARPPSPAQYTRAIEELVLSYPPSFREQATLVARAVPAPGELPRFSAMFVAPSGNLWFVTTPPGASATRMTVHRISGELVATAELPHALTVFEVGSDYLLGRADDADGGQAVVLYRYR